MNELGKHLFAVAIYQLFALQWSVGPVSLVSLLPMPLFYIWVLCPQFLLFSSLLLKASETSFFVAD